jgi:predicted transcriptional regulator
MTALETPRSRESAARVRQIMQREVITLSPDQTLREAMHVLTGHDISGAPVCDRLGRVVGVFSKTDAMQVCLLGGFDKTVHEVMMPMVFSIGDDAPIEAAIELMAFEGVHRLVILSPEGELIGILTPIDVMRHLAELERGSLSPRLP